MEEIAFSEKHMGTDVSILITTNSTKAAALTAQDFFTEIKAAEEYFSRFLPDSELSILNLNKKHIVSDLFISVLKKSISLSKMTAGAFNPLIQVSRAGYNKDYLLLKDSTREISSEPYDIDLSKIHIDESTREVTLQPDQNLDFGGILKGYLAEKIAKQIILDSETCGLIINIGGDLYTRGHDANGYDFCFLLYNPVIQDEISISLKDKSLVTSGSYKRQWFTEDGMRHHIISPNGIDNFENSTIAASVSHKDGSVAEAFAKYLLNKRPAEIDKNILPKDLHYFLFQTDGSVITSTI